VRERSRLAKKTADKNGGSAGNVYNKVSGTLAIAWGVPKIYLGKVYKGRQKNRSQPAEYEK